jgi:saccharopine dehydrogenase-like NADP-dependent oxidoreductase
MNNIVILGGGQIGRAAAQILSKYCWAGKRTESVKTLADTLPSSTFIQDNAFFDSTVQCWDKLDGPGISELIDFRSVDGSIITDQLREVGATHVINALPFFLNEKVAIAAAKAGCHYIDFTEDDEMAEKVQGIYSATNLTCAVKCGLAPGFINYLGHSLASKIQWPERLMIAVGALPRHVNFKDSDPGASYNLSWSVDGLVNEYIRPCTVRIKGTECKIPPLTGLEKVIIDGAEYEAAYTSGGIGSMVKELKHVPNVYYKTLRYPGHYKYVADAIERHQGKFDGIKREFISKFPYNSNDIIIVYAECVGTQSNGTLKRETFSQTFIGMNGLSAIQSTTAGGAICVLELILKSRISGLINHKDIPFGAFLNTETYKSTYCRGF